MILDMHDYAINCKHFFGHYCDYSIIRNFQISHRHTFAYTMELCVFAHYECLIQIKAAVDVNTTGRYSFNRPSSRCQSVFGMTPSNHTKRTTVAVFQPGVLLLPKKYKAPLSSGSQVPVSPSWHVFQRIRMHFNLPCINLYWPGPLSHELCRTLSEVLECKRNSLNSQEISRRCCRKTYTLYGENSLRKIVTPFFLFGSFSSALPSALCWFQYSATTSA